MGSFSEVLIEQIQTILIVLERPVVQNQLLALAGAALVAWLLAEGLPFLLRRWGTVRFREALAEESGRLWRRWVSAVNLILFPVLSLILVRLAAQLFINRQEPAGLLIEALFLFWVLLAYRIIVFLLYLAFGQKAAIYHRRVLTPLFVIVIGLGLLANFLDTNLLAQIELVNFFDIPITLGTLLAAIIVFYLFLVFSWLLQDLLREVVMPRTDADPGVTNSILTITRYVVIALGIVVTASTLGFGLSNLALIGGGLSIGIGFGLQQIVANFISGIVLLFEQSLRPGDFIEIGEEFGMVKKLNIRSTIVQTNDNVEIIVPNESFLTSQVTTYTKTDRLIRVSIAVGVSYGSDPKEVRRLLLETAVQHGLVKKNPNPIVFFDAFGDSSLNFRLSVWIDEPRLIPRVRSDLYFMVWETLAKHDIEIPFPQRDLNLRGGWERLHNETTSF